MDTDGDSLRDLEESARQVGNNRLIRAVARAGLAAHGVMHLLVAWLAVRVAMGSRAVRADQTGARQILAGQHWGGCFGGSS